ncbi:structural protein [Cellulophaga phage phi19:2]|uniref:Structural protein n=3 Tax=Cellulophaga phage phiST TaxID=756282 RepID=M4SL70_9CAUD|nr:portal protein [Cellulophaga phage phiST]AGH56723.1 hypothetical protein CGPG_00024 [Cellulophaga phage phiST]AGO47225.1 structural protein [Cellulophaga phage phiST]AGO48721.1 structural protein [Cellulophaga phage phi19:2]AGO49091.1 structural protein [Cellulophaga phage phi13:1]
MSFTIQQHIELTQIETKENSSLGIMQWGRSNSFPQTLKNLIEQSPTAKPTVSRTAKFYKGGSFQGENTIISNYGLTLKKVVSIMADDYATFNAFALQANFNAKGLVTSINPMRIAELRYNQFDELNYASKIGYHPNFGSNSEIKKTINQNVTKDKIKWFHRFNPENVIDQIKSTEGGFGNYLGQILYHSEDGHSSYPIPNLQAPINYVLSDIENSILVRKETSTGFISTYLLKTTLDHEDSSLIALENAIVEAQGARGQGKVITLSGLTPDDLAATLLEEIGSGGSGAKVVIESAKLTYDLDKEVISNAYLIPPALSGIDRNTGFSGEDLEEAYDVFNAITQGGRDIIENELNRVLENSIFNVKSVQLNPLELDLKSKSKPKTKADV